MVDEQKQLPRVTLQELLYQFGQQLRSGENFSPGAALARLETYNGWQQVADAHKKELSECLLAFIADPAEGRRQFLGLIEQKSLFPDGSDNEGLPQLSQREHVGQNYPAEPISPTRERVVASYLEQERQKVAEAVLKRRKITQNFFSKYYEQLFRGHPEKPEAVRKIITEENRKLEEGAPLKTFEDIRNELVERTRKYGTQQDIDQVVTLIEKYAPEMNASEVWRPLENARTAAIAILEYPDVSKPDVIVRAVDAGSSATQAGRYARTYEMVSQYRSAGKRANPFGEESAKIISNIFPGPTEEMAQKVLTETYIRVTSAPDFLDQMGKRLGVDELGKSITSSSGFQNFLLANNKYIAQYRTSSGVGILSDIVSAARPRDGDMQDYLAALYERARIRVAAAEASAREAGERAKLSVSAPSVSLSSSGAPQSREAVVEFAPNPTEFMLTVARNAHPQMFHYVVGESPFTWILQFVFGSGIKTAAAKTAVVAGEKVVAKGFFGKMFAGLGLKAVGLSNPLAFVFTFGGDIWSFVSGIVMGGVNRVTRGIEEGAQNFNRALSQQRDPYSATGWIFPLVLVSLVFLLPFMATWNTRGVWDSAGLPIGAGGPGQENHYVAPQTCDPASDPMCVPQYCDPTKGDCSWPLPAGCITSLAGHSGGLNAIDIGTNIGGDPHLPVQASCGGTVYIKNMILGDGEKCGSRPLPPCGSRYGNGYGNFIDLVCDDGKTQFRYGHLLKPGDAIVDGGHVDKGRIIAISNDNGNSSGPHLHFEYCAVGQCGKLNPGVGIIDTILPIKPTLGYCIK